MQLHSSTRDVTMSLMSNADLAGAARGGWLCTMTNCGHRRYFVFSYTYLTRGGQGRRARKYVCLEHATTIADRFAVKLPYMPDGYIECLVQGRYNPTAVPAPPRALADGPTRAELLGLFVRADESWPGWVLPSDLARYRWACRSCEMPMVRTRRGAGAPTWHLVGDCGAADPAAVVGWTSHSRPAFPSGMPARRQWTPWWSPTPVQAKAV